MSDTQSFDKTSNPTVTKLLEVDSELAVQEAELLFQLESIQEKRQSLHTVISLFTKADTPATIPAELAQISPPDEIGKVLEPVSNLATPPLETSKTFATDESETEVAPNTKSKATKTTTPSPAQKALNTKSTQKAKTDEKGLEWQQYLREEFMLNSLPEAVASVLQHQAERVFEIPAIVNAVFTDNLPNELRSKVRRQVTNILSKGAQKNKWYRGQLGYYSMSRSVAKDHLASSRSLA